MDERKQIAKAIRAYVRSARADLRGQDDDGARMIRSELKRTAEIADRIEAGDIESIANIGA